ncbi:MAG: hypothetical protein AUK47_28915 [Deltaproteobacteria bacterium CG2_30_63_29]|nr:MAG: hypothetical protein AUK47_28915 [Deltaproteobacteria bacterium CG2_30_63_29]
MTTEETLTTASETSVTPDTEALSTSTAQDLPEVTDAVINQTVRDLNDLIDRTGLDVALKVGELLIERFYGGDVALTRDTNPSKHVSIRKLAKHPDLPVKATVLHRHISIYVMCKHLGVSPGGHLGVSHLREVLGLPEKDQKRLLAKAEEKGWSRRTLEAEAKKVRESLNVGRGRRPLPGFVKGIRGLSKYVEGKTDMFGDFDDEHLAALAEDEVEALYKTVTAMRLKCEELQGRLQAIPRFGGDFIDVEPEPEPVAEPEPKQPVTPKKAKTPAKPKGTKTTKADPKKKPSRKRKSPIETLAAKVLEYLASQEAPMTRKDIVENVTGVTGVEWDVIEGRMLQDGQIVREGDGYRAAGKE